MDDHPEARAALERRLKGVANVASAEDLAGALQAAARLQPAIIICDVRLRHGDGKTLVRALAALPSTLAVIVHTSFLKEEERAQLIESGVATLVLKEAGVSALAAVIRTRLAQAKEREARE